MNNIILCGFKACGKSSLAQRVASCTDYRYVDTDLLISQDVRNLYCEQGETFFRNREEEVISSLRDIRGAIIATGGGSVLSALNCAILKEVGILIYLRVEKAELQRRIFSKPLPSFFDVKDPFASFEQVYATRIPMYERVADYTVDQEEKLWEILDFLQDKRVY